MNKEQERKFRKLKQKSIGTIYVAKKVDFVKNNYFKIDNNNKQLPIYYIFENCVFSSDVWFSVGENAHLIFKNCRFHKQICINSLGDVTFENNKYYDDANYPTYPEYFFHCQARNLMITEDSFINSHHVNGNENNIFGLNIKCQFLTINDSSIESESGKINIVSKETIIFNSNINTSIIEIDTQDIYTVNSHIKSNDYISFKNINTDYNEIDGVVSSKIIYNNNEIESPKILSI